MLFRSSLNAHPCACSERARILRALLRTFLRSLAAPQGAPFGRHPAAEAPARALFVCAGFIEKRTIVSTQCRDARIRAPTGAVRGAEHRRLRGISPKGRGDGSPRSRSSTGTVLSERPRVAEKRRAVRFARCESDHRVRCLAFLVTFWALRRRSGANSAAGREAAQGRMPEVMPKSNRLARRARRSSAREKERRRKAPDTGLTSSAAESRQNDALRSERRPERIKCSVRIKRSAQVNGPSSPPAAAAPSAPGPSARDRAARRARA